MNGTQQVQVAPDCLQSTTNFGSTVMINVCDGSQHVVPWGGADWVLAMFLIGLGVAMLTGAFAIVRMMLND